MFSDDLTPWVPQELPESIKQIKRNDYVEEILVALWPVPAFKNRAKSTCAEESIEGSVRDDQDEVVTMIRQYAIDNDYPAIVTKATRKELRHSASVAAQRRKVSRTQLAAAKEQYLALEQKNLEQDNRFGIESEAKSA